MSRPRGTFGAVARALLAAASQQPATVRQLATRAQVGYATARCAASRLQAQGALVPQGLQRPQVLAVPDIEAGAALTDLQSCLSGWVRPADRLTFEPVPARSRLTAEQPDNALNSEHVECGNLNPPIGGDA